jgi:hypothetical protein
MYEVKCKRLNPNEKTPHDTKNDRWCTKWSNAKIGQSTFGGLKLEALTKLLALTKAITHVRTLKRTRKADMWLLKALCDLRR